MRFRPASRRPARWRGSALAPLRRRLAQEGTSWRKVRDELRLEAARCLLVETDRPLGEIAAELCYADQANSTRAFRRGRDGGATLRVPPAAGKSAIRRLMRGVQARRARRPVARNDKLPRGAGLYRLRVPHERPKGVPNPFVSGARGDRVGSAVGVGLGPTR
ncbi:MAG: helix-turn-helix domain-containing protein [Deltaproteobacteria bacterium]|nr:helix-turn-helix domain-containing protein [Deltaproteobacteria bacterium]